MFSRLTIGLLSTKQLIKTCRYLSIHNSRLIRKQKSTELVKSILENNIANDNDWKQMRGQILQSEDNQGQFSVDTIDSAILNYCIQYNNDLGFSYINFLKKENIKINLATVGKHLMLIYLKNEKYLLTGNRCPDTEEKYILNYYNSLRKEYPILDSNTLGNVVLVLVLTSQWQKCLDLKKEIEIASVTTAKTDSAMVAAAFLNGEHDLAWKLLEDMFSKEKMPLSIPFITYINIAKQHKLEEAKSKLERLLLFFQENDYICNEDFISNLSSFLKAKNFQGSPVNVTPRGYCNNCHQNLDKYELSTEEFKELKKVFFENVIIGKDVFLKSNPEELESFKHFLKGMTKYDVVLDGLNVAHRAGLNPPKIMSQVVASVVSYFVEQNKKVLLIGRSHMKTWPSNNWNYITKNSTVFLTQNISQDDPYLLYCALNSGKDTIIVTNDLMRQHKYRLKSPKYKLLFSRWLSQRQYQIQRINAMGRPIFRYVSFNVTSQKSGSIWHIPYKQDGSDTKGEYHNTWFCLKWK